MSTESALIITTVVCFGVLLCAWRVVHALQEESERDRIVAEARDATSTGDMPWLQILEDAEEYVDQYAVFDPELADSFDRLPAVIPLQREEEDR